MPNFGCRYLIAAAESAGGLGRTHSVLSTVAPIDDTLPAPTLLRLLGRDPPEGGGGGAPDGRGRGEQFPEQGRKSG